MGFCILEGNSKSDGVKLKIIVSVSIQTDFCSSPNLNWHRELNSQFCFKFFVTVETRFREVQIDKILVSRKHASCTTLKSCLTLRLQFLDRCKLNSLLSLNLSTWTGRKKELL